MLKTEIPCALASLQLQYARIAQFRRDFTTDGGSIKVNQSKKNSFLSRHRKKWLVQLANLSRQKAQKAQNRNVFYVPFLRIFSLFTANQLKCLSMNHLHTKPSSSGQAQSSPVKPN